MTRSGHSGALEYSRVAHIWDQYSTRRAYELLQRCFLSRMRRQETYVHTRIRLVCRLCRAVADGCASAMTSIRHSSCTKFEKAFVRLENKRLHSSLSGKNTLQEASRRLKWARSRSVQQLVGGGVYFGKPTSAAHAAKRIPQDALRVYLGSYVRAQNEGLIRTFASW